MTSPEDAIVVLFEDDMEVVFGVVVVLGVDVLPLDLSLKSTVEKIGDLEREAGLKAIVFADVFIIVFCGDLRFWSRNP